jgi:hypothetical protein
MCRPVFGDTAVPIPGAGLFRNCPRGSRIVDLGAIYEEEIDPAIIVIIEQGGTRAHGFEQILLGCVRSSMFEMDSQG